MLAPNLVDTVCSGVRSSKREEKTMQVQKIARKTNSITKVIIKTLEMNGYTPTSYLVGRVKHNYLITGCGLERDLLDALVIVFGDAAEDFEIWESE